MFTAPAIISLTEEQASRFTGYPVKLPLFEGPLDLLLYLIRRQEIDIYDIPIARITGQFLDYLLLLEKLDIEIAGDFLVMSATLLEIKSRMLLPKPPALEEEAAEEEDPRAELVRKLLEYQQYKSAAEELNRRAEEQKRCFPRTDVVPNLSFSRPEALFEGNPDGLSLWMALQEMMVRIESTGPLVREVSRPKVTIRQQMVHILKMIGSVPNGISFTDLIFYEGRENTPTRIEVILTFLALLELMRLRRAFVKQTELFGDIRIVAEQARKTGTGSYFPSPVTELH